MNRAGPYPSKYPATAQFQKEIMACHETVNHRLKEFGVLSKRFRHSIHLHPMCFMAVVNITQIMIELGERLYQL